ncbi:hypothetical protein [Streptomyces sp. NPDC001530]
MNQEATMDALAESAPNGGVNASSEGTGAWRTFSCLALDLGL